MLIKALIVLAGLLLLVLLAVAIVAVQPSHYRVVRTASITAPPASVFGLINDFRQWDGWSPWAKLDPDMKVTYTGAASGPGAVYYWAGNDKVGEGRMTILRIKPNEEVVIKLEFLRPFPSGSLTTFRLMPESSGTKVDWIMEGDHTFLSKAALLVMGGMDKAVGPDFERGLARMKALAEAPVAARN